MTRKVYQQKPLRYTMTVSDEEVAQRLIRETGIKNVSIGKFVVAILHCLNRFNLSLARDGDMLDEMEAFSRLSKDSFFKQIPELAEEARRDPVDHLLYLAEKGYQLDLEQRKKSAITIAAANTAKSASHKLVSRPVGQRTPSRIAR